MIKIAFPLNHSECIPLYSGDACISSLMTLGALMQTAKYSVANDCYEIHTDAEGLDAAQNAASDAMDALIGAVGAVGHLMTTCDSNEVESKQWASLSWLIVGLTELVHDVKEASSILDKATPLVTAEDKEATP